MCSCLHLILEEVKVMRKLITTIMAAVMILALGSACVHAEQNSWKTPSSECYKYCICAGAVKACLDLLPMAFLPAF